MTSKTRLPTITDVARHADVSIGPVSRVLNSTGPAQPQKLEQMRLAMEKFPFIPRYAGRVLVSKLTNTIFRSFSLETLYGTSRQARSRPR